MEDGRDNRIKVDEDGKRWLTDENGKLLKDERGNNIPPSTSRVVSNPGEFTIFDSSQGHCALCGSISCRGNCFK